MNIMFAYCLLALAVVYAVVTSKYVLGAALVFSVIVVETVINIPLLLCALVLVSAAWALPLAGGSGAYELVVRVRLGRGGQDWVEDVRSAYYCIVPHTSYYAQGIVFTAFMRARS